MVSNHIKEGRGDQVAVSRALDLTTHCPGPSVLAESGVYLWLISKFQAASEMH